MTKSKKKKKACDKHILVLLLQVARATPPPPPPRGKGGKGAVGGRGAWGGEVELPCSQVLIRKGTKQATGSSTGLVQKSLV